MSAWLARYRAYDDAALETLANAGLLRRASKDVEAGKLAWGERTDAHGLIETDGQTVRLDAGGVEAARCTCPASGCCKHILAAVLWLRGEAPDAATGTEQPDPDAAQVEALALDPAQLQKLAGKVATRRARQWSETLGTPRVSNHGLRLAIAFDGLEGEVSYLAGAGFDGMLSEARDSERKALHLAALAGLFRAHGQPWAWTAESAPADTTRDGLGEAERELLASVQQLLHELLGQGLSHVSRASALQLRLLNLGARSEGLPRLAGHLRTLGGQITRLAERDDHSSEREALVQMARVHALCQALLRADSERLPQLRGRLRRDYQAGETLDLLPLGGHWWSSAGGARGLSLAFWDLNDGQVLETTLARPDGGDPGFRRDAVWAQQALWRSTPERLCRAPLRLEGPRLAEDGRLAAGAGVAQAREGWLADDPRLLDLGLADWEQLGLALEDSAALASEPPTRLLLRPARCHEASLDEARQVLTWPLEDGNGRTLLLELPCTAERRERLDNLERAQKALGDIRAVLVRPWLDGRRRCLEPLALLVADHGRLRCLSLDFESLVRGGLSRNRRLFERIQRLLSGIDRSVPATEPPSLAGRLVEPALDVLESLASSGRQQPSVHQRDVLRAQRGLAEAAGVAILAQALGQLAESPKVSAQPLLRATHLMSRLLALG